MEWGGEWVRLKDLSTNILLHEDDRMLGFWFSFSPKYANENTVCQLRITSKEECALGQQCQLYCVGKQWKSILRGAAIF